MSPSTRLILCAGIIAVSAMYAVLVAHDPAIAAAVAVYYVAIVITAFVLTNIWKRPS